MPVAVAFHALPLINGIIDPDVAIGAFFTAEALVAGRTKALFNGRRFLQA